MNNRAAAVNLSSSSSLAEYLNKVGKPAALTADSLDVIYNVHGDAPYAEVLSIVQEHMASIEGFDTEKMSADDVFRYKKHIADCIRQKGLKCKEANTLSELQERLYNSMVKYDVLTRYLQPEVYNELGIEEIYGRWNCIYILAKNTKVKMPEKFPSLEHCKNILNRISRGFDRNINKGTPVALGELAANIRASIVSNPISSDDMGPEFNIRIVHGSKMQRKLLLKGNTINEAGLRFLELCIRYKVNICIAGATGSGKTGTMYYLLSHMTQDSTYRVGTIEIESREFNLVLYDDNGECVNDVFHWVTRQSDDERYNITANDLVEKVLRFKPDIVGVGEMRNREALMTCELAITGHGVITTIHASSAHDTYDRIVTLCKKSGIQYDDKTLYQLALQAFPIIVFQHQNKKTGARRIFEIAEGIEYKDGKVITNPLIKYVVTDTQEKTGLTVGTFHTIGQISDKLRQTLIDQGCTRADIADY